jgi:ATP-dependent helicase/DNAse subunit B
MRQRRTVDCMYAITPDWAKGFRCVVTLKLGKELRRMYGMGKPTWSFSSIKTFDQCPKKYYHTKVLKDYKEDFNTEAILYGNEFHEAAELYVRGDVETLRPKV